MCFPANENGVTYMKTIVTNDLRRTVRILNEAHCVFHLTAIDRQIQLPSTTCVEKGKSPYEELQEHLGKKTETRLVIYVVLGMNPNSNHAVWEIIVN